MTRLDDYAAKNPGQHPSTYVNRFFPELSVLDAVAELREQVHGEKTAAKQPYPGRRSGVDAVDYLLKNYGTEIKGGRLGPGQLHLLDQNLYVAVRHQLSEAKPPATIAAFLESHAPEEKHGSAFQRRIRACAQILDTDEESTARFLSNVRGDRLRPNGEKSRRR